MSKRATTVNAGQRLSRTSGKGSSSKARLAKRLLEWATEEMKYVSETEEKDALRQEDIQLLMRGELAGVLEFVVNQVKAPSKAEVIRGNLALHNVDRGGGGGGGGGGGNDGGGRGGMEEERSRLEKEEASLKTAVEQMTKDVARLRENITNLAEGARSVESSVAKVSQSSTLLSAHSLLCEETVRALQEFDRRIRARVDLFRRPEGKEVCYYPRHEEHGEREVGEEEMQEGGGKTTALDSACTHSVRIICSQLEKKLSVCEGTSDGERKKGMDHAWKLIENLLTQHTPGEILSSLAEVTQQTSDNIHSQTLSIDLNRDAQQLKYSYQGEGGGEGGMKDVSEGHSLLNIVEERLMEAQLCHIQRSVKIERARRAAEEARSETSQLQTEAIQLLEKNYGQPGIEEEHLELAKLLYTRLDLECAGSQAVLDGLTSIVSSLDEARSERQRAVEELQTKLRKIQEFARVAESKQKEIQTLVVHNSSARSRLQKQQLELQVYVKEKVTGHQRELTDAVNSMRDSVSHEIKVFAGLSLERLLKAPSSEVPSCDLSINSLHGGRDQLSGCSSSSVTIVTKILGLSQNSTPENVLTKLLKAQEKVQKLEMDIGEVDQALEQMRGSIVNTYDNTLDLLANCRDHENRLSKKAIPTLQECLSRASSGLAGCERVSKTLDHWWSQPAQFLTPWVTHSEVTSEQWVDRWKVLAAKFSELSSGGSGGGN